MRGERDYIVYRHISPSGKMYVGITKRRPQERWGYGEGYNKQPKFFNAIKKYGWGNFDHEILLENLTSEQAGLAERLFIAYWNLTDDRYGYNAREGGVNNYHIGESTRKKMSKKKLGKNNPFYGCKHSKESRIKMGEAISKALKGKPKTEEWKNNLRLANLGKKHSEEHKQRLRQTMPTNISVKQIDPHTDEVITTFYSQMEAFRQTGINGANISRCCSGKRKTAGGYKWEYND